MGIAHLFCCGGSEGESPPVNSICQIKKQAMPVFFVWWSGCLHRRTPLLSFIFALKSFFNIVKRDIVDAQRFLARIDDQREMVIVQIDRVYHTTLLMEGKLNQRLYEIDLEANEMLETIIPRLAAERGIDEDLKARDMLRWVAEMNNIKASAEEIVSREVIFV